MEKLGSGTQCSVYKKNEEGYVTVMHDGGRARRSDGSSDEGRVP